jgi:hypothetical protein
VRGQEVEYLKKGVVARDAEIRRRGPIILIAGLVECVPELRRRPRRSGQGLV